MKDASRAGTGDSGADPDPGHAEGRSEELGVGRPLGPDAPLIPDPPAPGAVPPAGVPFVGRERTRRDPGLRWTWLAVVVTIMAAGVVVIAFGLWQLGSSLIGAGMIIGALMRLGLPSRQAGLLLVRGRIFDVLWMLAIGVGIIVMVLVRS
ncbi:DUF3017 domain-containing protein [Raineyella fluvialis]|uniref:DUF3017 domain-containing protein n=1 Tax=Raineyella fluvialis TaxID=2662261 RepID=A0A5Q2FAW7_9ACTN|nr:DUF3017 domain-containing protein [Raineyella fluvialis]QGF22524.1 DUF3017 domain-containing protein [Raineyella fluvialis]